MTGNRFMSIIRINERSGAGQNFTNLTTLANASRKSCHERQTTKNRMTRRRLQSAFMGGDIGEPLNAKAIEIPSPRSAEEHQQKASFFLWLHCEIMAIKQRSW